MRIIKSKRVLAPILILLIIVFIALLGFKIYKTQFVYKPTPIRVKRNGKTTQVSDSNLANWRTYINTKYNYRLTLVGNNWKFGSSAPFDEQSDATKQWSQLAWTRVVSQSDDQSSNSYNHMHFSIGVYHNPNRLTLKEWTYFVPWAQEKMIGHSFRSNLSVATPQELMTVDELVELRKKARFFNYPENMHESIFQDFPALIVSKELGKSLYFIKEEYVFQLEWSIADHDDPTLPAANLFNQILSTFKFLDN